MSIEKQLVIDKIEVNAVGVVSVRTAAQFIEDGSVITTTFHRHTIQPGDDYSQENERVKSICDATHTSETIAAYAALTAQGA